MTDERIKMEWLALETLPKATFKFMGFNTDKPHLVIGQQTNSGKVYTIKIDLSNNYPNKEPAAFIVSPKPLLTYSGESMLSASHSMHTLTGDNGCVQVCHYGGSDWHPNVFLYQIVIKIRFWLEAYEHHLKRGEPLSNYLPG